MPKRMQVLAWFLEKSYRNVGVDTELRAFAKQPAGKNPEFLFEQNFLRKGI